MEEPMTTTPTAAAAADTAATTSACDNNDSTAASTGTGPSTTSATTSRATEMSSSETVAVGVEVEDEQEGPVSRQVLLDQSATTAQVPVGVPVEEEEKGPVVAEHIGESQPDKDKKDADEITDPTAAAADHIDQCRAARHVLQSTLEALEAEITPQQRDGNMDKGDDGDYSSHARREVDNTNFEEGGRGRAVLVRPGAEFVGDEQPQETDSVYSIADTGNHDQHHPHSSGNRQAPALAVATPLSQDMVDEESYLPVAVPHDRDAADAEREKASKASFVWIGLAMVVLVVVIIASVVGGLCGSGLCQGGGDGGSQNQTTAPSHRQVQYPQFQEQLQSVFGNGYMSDEDDEHWILAKQALDWIVLEDPSQLEPDDPQMVQRYILALFYMATSQNGPWTDCSPPPKDRPEAMECSYYFDLPGDTNQKRIALRWLSNSSECWWGGIQCSDGIVTELAIADNKIEGTLPTEVAMLTHLATLWIAYNKVTILRDTGDAAADLTLSLPTSLTSLMVTRNQFSGTIPTELFGPALRLNRIWLIENLFTGPIPTEIGLFQGFELDLGFNSLSGTLPSEMFTNPNIKWLSIGMNKRISGTIPSEIGLATSLRYLTLGPNGLSGTLPTELGLLSDLEFFTLPEAGLNGTLPEELYFGLTRLRGLEISKNAFSGTISTYIGLMQNLAILDMTNNKFSGSLPEQIFSNTTDFYSMLISGNPNLTGTIPDAVCRAVVESEERYYIGVEADCLTNSDTGVPNIVCPKSCCSVCCDPITGVCLDQ